MKRHTVMMICWAMILVTIVGIMTAFGFKVKSRISHYEELEEKLVRAATKYVDEEKKVIDEGEMIEIKSRELMDNNYLDNLIYNKDICTGYVEVNNNNGYKYKAYIKCNKYKTSDYKK